MEKTKTLQLSTRGQNLPKSAIRKLIPLSIETEKRGIRIIKLNIGQPDIETPEEFWEGIRNFKEKVLAYSPSEGRPEYIQSLIKYYKKTIGLTFSEEEIIGVVGGMEGLLFILLTIAGPEDEIIIPEPFYSNYQGITSMSQVKFVTFTTYAENGYHLPERSVIEKLITSRTRAIMIASPGNPTGCVYTRKEMEMIGQIAKDHGLFVLSDEVYREFSYDGEPVTSILQIPGMEQHGIILDSVSKRYSACGARLGCVISHNREFMAVIKSYATVRLSAPTLDQIGIANCVNTPDSYFTRVKREYTERRDIVVNALNSIKDVVCHRPGGAFYAMAKIKGVDTEDFSKWLLKDFNDNGETVLIAPGEGFYATPGVGRDEIRIAYVFKTEILKRGMEILVKGIEEYRRTH